MSSAYNCHKCGKEFSTGSNDKISFKETCSSCNADLHICHNCKFYDQTAYNECSETQAERVLDKNKANYCDYFHLGNNQTSKADKSKDDARKKLDDLFK